MSEEDYLSLRKLLNEPLLRDLILFFLLFFFIVAQEWPNLFLIIFPIITFSFALIFRFINTNKFRLFNANIVYNPLGSERNHANRLNFCALVQLILLFWIGSESLSRPQLIDNYSIFFNILFIFVFSFGFYWIFIDSWKNSKIEVLVDEPSTREAISSLKLTNYKKISIISLFLFLILNLLNLLFSGLTLLGTFEGIPCVLPGTGIQSSEPLTISYISFGTMVISPISAMIFLTLSYKDVKNFSHDKLSKFLEKLPEDAQKIVKDNLNSLSEKI